MQKKINLYWLWMPVVHCVILILGYSICYFYVGSLGGDLANILYDLLFVMLYSLVVAPLMAVFYCMKLHRMGLGWTKYLCCAYNSVMMGLYFVVGMILFTNCPINLKYVWFTLISFPGLSVIISGLMCGVVTLVICDVKSALSSRNNRKSDSV